MARAVKFGLSISWPIIAAMFAQTWMASKWVSQIETAIVGIERQMQAFEKQSDARLTRLENIYFKQNQR